MHYEQAWRLGWLSCRERDVGIDSTRLEYTKILNCLQMNVEDRSSEFEVDAREIWAGTQRAPPLPTSADLETGNQHQLLPDNFTSPSVSIVSHSHPSDGVCFIHNGMRGYEITRVVVMSTTTRLNLA
jgi:hypothetical protein